MPLSKDDLAALAEACRAPKAPPWQGALKLVAASLALAAVLWGGATYLFVTESRAAQLHADMRKDVGQELDKMIQALQLINQRDAVQDVRIDGHEKRLDAASKGGRR